MKKQHDAVGLANELEGASAFFQPQSPPPPLPKLIPNPTEDPPLSATSPVQQIPAVERTSDRSDDRTAVQPAGRSLGKRPTQRRAFEFYRDQLETFKRWSALEMAEGGEGNMSIWARQALDDYIAKRDGHERATERSTDRSDDRRAG